MNVLIKLPCIIVYLISLTNHVPYKLPCTIIYLVTLPVLDGGENTLIPSDPCQLLNLGKSRIVVNELRIIQRPHPDVM